MCDAIIKENTDEKGYWKPGVDVADLKWLWNFDDDTKREKQFLEVFNEKYPEYVKRFDIDYLKRMYHFFITDSNQFIDKDDYYSNFSSGKIHYTIITRQVY